MSSNETILRFSGVTFYHNEKKPLLDEVDFTVRKGNKITIMGQNGAGKSTIFKLITKALKPQKGTIHMDKGLTFATAFQVIAPEDRDLTVKAFFEKCFSEKIYNIDVKIKNVLDVVNLVAPSDRIISSFSGGQQARLLLAAALIQEPDLLLLDEPTNNLDPEGIWHLTAFLMTYTKTCIVISHDADFLNAFTDGVLYLDAATKKVEQYTGDYYNVVEEIKARIEKENRKNTLLAKEIQANKDQANAFANKGGKLRLIAKKMRDKAEELAEEIVDVRREDRAIRDFTIPVQDDLKGDLIKITSYMMLQEYIPIEKKANISLRKGQHLLLAGPNGIGKSTLLESLANGTAKGVELANDLVIGYYRQDFSTLNFEHTVWESLLDALGNSESREAEQYMRSTAAGFQVSGAMMATKIGHLSEGQKGLVAFTRLVLQKPGLLILDEPTNHINFRHLPVIAKALSEYEGAMILVSHVHDFVDQIRIDQVLDLSK
ncbi:MAG: ATP-binding cassette domain-containing protein [Candidatus Gracilibacteria bacterium]